MREWKSSDSHNNSWLARMLLVLSIGIMTGCAGSAVAPAFHAAFESEEYLHTIRSGWRWFTIDQREELQIRYRDALDARSIDWMTSYMCDRARPALGISAQYPE